MLCGHIHRAYILESGTPESLVPHDFPVVVGSACYFEENDMWGTALTVENGNVTVSFTDSTHKVRQTHEITLK